jgi:hypothetical protein
VDPILGGNAALRRLATTWFWYRHALSFVAEDEIPAYLRDVPELPALP